MTHPSESATVHDENVRVRRTPKFSSFMAVGAGLGVVVGVALAASQRVSGPESLQQVIGFMALLSGTIGLAVGATIAVILDRSLSARARTVQAKRTEVVNADDAA